MNSTCKMNNYKLQQYITVYGRETELAETVFSLSPVQTVLKKILTGKKKNYTKLDLEMFELLAERG